VVVANEFCLEIALKNRLGKLPLPAPFGSMYPSSLVTRDIHLLPIEAAAHRPVTNIAVSSQEPV